MKTTNNSKINIDNLCKYLPDNFKIETFDQLKSVIHDLNILIDHCPTDAKVNLSENLSKELMLTMVNLRNAGSRLCNHIYMNRGIVMDGRGFIYAGNFSADPCVKELSVLDESITSRIIKHFNTSVITGYPNIMFSYYNSIANLEYYYFYEFTPVNNYQCYLIAANKNESDIRFTFRHYIMSELFKNPKVSLTHISMNCEYIMESESYNEHILKSIPMGTIIKFCDGYAVKCGPIDSTSIIPMYSTAIDV